MMEFACFEFSFRVTPKVGFGTVPYVRGSTVRSESTHKAGTTAIVTVVSLEDGIIILHSYYDVVYVRIVDS